MTHPLLSAIEQRSSVNHFDPQYRLDDASVEALVAWAGRAPSAFNLQNWRFVAVRSEAGKQRLRELAWNQAKVSEAAVTFIVCGVLPRADSLGERLSPSVTAGFMRADLVTAWQSSATQMYADVPHSRRDEAIRSATFAASTLMLAGQALGLAASPMSGFDISGVSHAFALREDEIPAMLVTMGKAQANNWPQKPRRPVHEILELA